MTDAILLDTHTAVWFSTNRLSEQAMEQLVPAVLGDGLLVSPITAWEIGALSGSPKKSAALGLNVGAGEWWRRLLANPGIRECSLDGTIAIASTALPGEFHKDPMDRMLVATARALDCALMTRDAEILAYAAQGHVKAIPC